MNIPAVEHEYFHQFTFLTADWDRSNVQFTDRGMNPLVNKLISSFTEMKTIRLGHIVLWQLSDGPLPE